MKHITHPYNIIHIYIYIHKYLLVCFGINDLIKLVTVSDVVDAISTAGMMLSGPNLCAGC